MRPSVSATYRHLSIVLFAASVFAQEKPVQLWRGMGQHHHPIVTANAEAQKYFNQGLLLLYGFNRYEAQRSFQKAAELDPGAAMPHWGLAATYAPHINMDLDGDVDLKKGCAAATIAAKLATAEHEKAYAEAGRAMCTSGDAYREALRALHRRYPDDPDAASLFAEALMVPVRWRWFANGKPAGEMAACIGVLEQVMKRDPDHPGANHFYVHAMEMSPNPEYALPSAQRLMGGIAPGAGHLVHMAGHTYFRVGDYEVVASSNERAVQVDEHYFHHSGVHGGYVGYYAHNLHFLTAARMMQGRFDDAYQAAEKMVERLKPMLNEMAALADPFVATPVFVLERFRKWDEILKLPEPEARLPVTRAMWRYARVLAYVGKGDRVKAAAEAREFEAAKARVPADAPFINNKASSILEIAAEVIAARMARDAASAIPHWRKAAAIQDGLIYDEPPPWYYPLRESLGAALLRAGKVEEAERVFRDDLDRYPRNGRSLFGLMHALKARKDDAGAEWVKMEFDKAWKRAQTELSLDTF